MAPRSARRRLLTIASAVALLVALAPSASGRGVGSGVVSAATTTTPVSTEPVPSGPVATTPPSPAPPSAPRVKPVSTAPIVSVPWMRGSWQVTATVAGQPVAWAARRSGVTLMRFDQHALRLELHPGTAEPGGGGWAYSNRIAGGEMRRVVAGFNAGFKFSYGSQGFMENGRTAVGLGGGLASIVTYRDGTTQIGTWRNGVPAPGRRILSVRQNLSPLIDHGAAAPDLESCVEACWGATDGGRFYVARSALGITASGELVWAAGASLSPAGLARALIGAGVRRAVELDINPEWVDGFLYEHRRGGPHAVGMVPGQNVIAGRLLRPYSRDFFTVVAR